MRLNPTTGELERGGGSGSGQAVWISKSSTAINQQTTVIDSIANSSFVALKYIISFYNADRSVSGSFEYNVLNDQGNYKETRTQIVYSAPVEIYPQTNDNAGTFELQFVNNQNYDVSIELAKLILN